MQVTVEATGNLERTMKVQVPEEKIAGEVQNRLQSMTRTTKVDGFRPGKVPLKVIQKRYGLKVREEVVGQVLQSSFYEAINQEKLRPAGNPSFDSLESNQGNGLAYTAKFEVMPEFELSAVDTLEIENFACDISDEDINAMIEKLRQQRRTLQDVERAAQDGDVLKVDFVGKVDGEVFEGGEAKDFEIEIGSGRLIAGFEEGLVGKNTGETASLDLKFPEEYHNKELSDKPVVFEVTINAIQEPVPAEMNDEFFAAFGVSEGGEEALRKQIQDHMEREVEALIRNRDRDSVMDSLLAANEIELPNSLVQAEQHQMQHEFNDRLKSQGIDMTGKENLTEPSMFAEQARKRVALQLIASEIVTKQGLKADPEKVRALIEKNAENYEDPTAIVNWYY